MLILRQLQTENWILIWGNVFCLSTYHLTGPVRTLAVANWGTNEKPIESDRKAIHLYFLEIICKVIFNVAIKSGLRFYNMKRLSETAPGLFSWWRFWERKWSQHSLSRYKVFSSGEIRFLLACINPLSWFCYKPIGITNNIWIVNGQEIISWNGPLGKSEALLGNDELLKLHTHQRSMVLLDIVCHDEIPPCCCCWYDCFFFVLR